MRKKPQWANFFANGFFTVGFFFYVYFLYTQSPISDFQFSPVSKIIWIPILGFVSYFNFLKDSEMSRDTWLYFLFFFLVQSITLTLTKNPRFENFINSICSGHATDFWDGLLILVSVGFLFYLMKHLIRKLI